MSFGDSLRFSRGRRADTDLLTSTGMIPPRAEVVAATAAPRASTTERRSTRDGSSPWTRRLAGAKAVNLDDLYRESQGTRFERFQPNPDEGDPKADESLLKALQESVERGR